MKVKVYSRSANLELYLHSKALYAALGLPCVRLVDKSADGYFYAMLSDTDCDVAINVDDDAFVTDPQAVMDLVHRVVDEGYANAGCPDGGTDALPRGGDPRVTNPFFNVFNLKLIRTKFDISSMKRSDDDLEPYYPFFHWMADNFKTLYLPARRHPDGFSTILLDVEGRMLCQHSWLARFFDMPSWAVRHFQPGMGNQRQRINDLIDESYAIRGMTRPVFTTKDRLSFAADTFLRWVVKVPQRMSRWPYKLGRRIRRARLFR